MKDMTKGNEAKLIFNFALPMLIGNIFQQLYNTVDSIIVGRYVGKEALAAVGTSFPIIFLLVSLIMGITIGSTILISQYYGARDMKSVRKTIDTTYIFLLFASITITIVGLLSSSALLKLLKTPDEVFVHAKNYLNITFIGMIGMFGYNSVSSILRGLGDSKTPLRFLIISTIINIVLDIIFVVPLKMGVEGAAWATIIAQFCSFVFGVYHLNKNHEVFKIKFKNIKFDKDIFKLTVKIGIPSGIQQVLFSFGMMAMQGLVNGFGANTMAGFNAATKVDSFASMPIMNFGAAISTFVGQNIGANKPERIKRGYNSTLIMTVGLSVATSIIINVFGVQLVSLFNTEPEVIKEGTAYIARVSSFYVLLAIMFISNGVMRGAGDTIFPMISSLLSMLIIRVPIAYFLAWKLKSSNGIWWSIPAGWLVGVIVTQIYYHTGRWKKKAVVKAKTTSMEG